jgi:hypothetical protein
MSWVLFLLVILAAYTTYFISSILPNLLRSRDRIILGILGNQATRGLTINPLLNIVLSFIGPVPNFLNQNYTAALYAPYSAFKMFSSLFAIMGGWYILKNRIIKLYPLLLFCFFNVILVLATYFSLDYRFSYTMVPFYFLLVVYGYKHFKSKYKPIIFISYYVMIFVLTLNYNIR